MNRKLISLLPILFLLLPFFGAAQMIDSMMKVYAEKFSQEKLYLQFDKKAYNPGDRIWFKAYVFQGFDPSRYSKSIFTELYDDNGNLILRNTAPIVESAASGNFDLPVNYNGTRIRVRAYTAWMLNFDTSFVYTRDLRIIGSAQDSVAHPSPGPTSLHFFPEGGDLVAGVENNIAFKAEDPYGKPRKISGTLNDKNGKVILSFSSTHNGMGKFLLVPEKSDVFYAAWKDENGIEQRTDLPAVKPGGATLRVMNSSGNLVFSVSRPADSTGDPRYVVIAHMNQQMVYRAVVNLKDVSMSGGNIPTQELPTGILQVTLFDMHQKPLAERVCFINNHNYSFDVKVNILTKSLKKRGRSELDVVLPGNVKSNLSIAITDAEVDGNRIFDDNIISRLLMTGDLHGYVRDPFYYFQNNSDSLVQQLDLVMLTHGWRRFKWGDLAAGKLPVIKYPAEDNISLNADIYGVDNSRIAHDESIIVFLQKKDSATNMVTVPYTRNGKFRVSGLFFYDTAKAYYQFTTDRKLSSSAAVVFNNGLYPGIKKLRPFNDLTLAVWSPDDSSLVRKSRQVFSEIARLQDQGRKIQNLEAVTVRVRVKSLKEKLDEQYSSGLFGGGNATIFDLLDDPLSGSYLNAFNYLQSKVAGLQIGTGNPPPLTWRGSSPGLYLDEIPSDANTIQTINVNDIAMIKVFSPGSSMGFGDGAGGVIAIYTKKGRDRAPDPSVKGLDMARIPGYSVVREFYSPDYLINPEPESDDIRTTLYWNPHLKPVNGNYKINIPFYNSDVTHQFRVIIEGLNDDGKLTHVEKIIE